MSMETTSFARSFPSPSNQLSLMVSALVDAIKPSTHLAWNLAWAYGPIMVEIPKRLGVNKALDASTAALLNIRSTLYAKRKVTSGNLGKFNNALEELRACLRDPAKVHASETLCAVMLLMICQVSYTTPVSDAISS